MTTRRVHAYPAERDGEILRRVELWTDRTWDHPTASGWYVLRVGVARGDYADFVGEWDQSKVILEAGTPIPLTGTADINYPLIPGDVCMVEIESNGAPPRIDGLSIVFRVSQIGETGGVAGPKQNANYPGPREVERPLFEAPVLADRETQGALNRLVDVMNDSGITEKVVAFPVPDLFRSQSRDIHWGWTDTLDTVNIGNATWTTMLSVTVGPLDSERVYRVMVTGFLNVQEGAGLTDVTLRVADPDDTTVTWGSINQTAPVLGAWEVMGTTAQYKVSARTYIQVHLQAYGTANTALAQEGSLSVQVCDVIGPEEV